MATRPEIADIAAGLTEAQRRVVLTDSSGFHPDHHGKWLCKTVKTERRMFDLGLIEEARCLSFPTPLGLAVRAYLKEKPHGI